MRACECVSCDVYAPCVPHDDDGKQVSLPLAHLVSVGSLQDFETLDDRRRLDAISTTAGGVQQVHDMWRRCMRRRRGVDLVRGVIRTVYAHSRWASQSSLTRLDLHKLTTKQNKTRTRTRTKHARRASHTPETCTHHGAFECSLIPTCCRRMLPPGEATDCVSTVDELQRIGTMIATKRDIAKGLALLLTAPGVLCGDGLVCLPAPRR